jgi:hypothetical protein
MREVLRLKKPRNESRLEQFTMLTPPAFLTSYDGHHRTVPILEDAKGIFDSQLPRSLIV